MSKKDMGGLEAQQADKIQRLELMIAQLADENRELSERLASLVSTWQLEGTAWFQLRVDALTEDEAVDKAEAILVNALGVKTDLDITSIVRVD